jgi:hypothetical protein
LIARRPHTTANSTALSSFFCFGPAGLDEGLAHLAMCCKQSAVTALADLERLGFLTRIRRIRRIMTALGFTTRQITNAYRVHAPASSIGLIAMTLFATESNSWTPSEADFYSKNATDRFRGVSERSPHGG